MALTTTQPMPAKIMPAWALEILERWRKPRRPWVSIDDDLEHRKAAFYRLYETGDADAKAMWRELDARLQPDERSGFIHAAILGTDEICQDEPLPGYVVTQHEPPRLRTKTQRRARKLAELIQLWRACTPPRCAAYETKASGKLGSIIELLVVAFHIGPVPLDYNLRWKTVRLGIEYTTDSKRGWMQHRRASDTVRAKLIETGRQLLALLADEQPGHWLSQNLDELLQQLGNLPSMAEEHSDSVMLLSQKSSYLDWFRYVCVETRHAAIASETSPLSIEGWATLARIVTGDQDIDRGDIAHAVRVCQVL